MDDLLALDLWDLVINVLRTSQGTPKPSQASTRERGVVPQSTPKIKQLSNQNSDLLNIDQIPPNAHLSEDYEAVIKMVIKGKSPTMEHASRTHRVAFDWLFDRTNLDGKIQIKYVESKNPLADILTKCSLTRDEWRDLLHLLHIMNDTTFSCSHLSKSHPFLSAGKQSEMKKRLQDVALFRGTAYLWDKVLRVTLQAQGVRVTLKCGTGEKGVQTPDVILLSLPRETESTCKRSFSM